MEHSSRSSRVCVSGRGWGGGTWLYTERARHETKLFLVKVKKQISDHLNRQSYSTERLRMPLESWGGSENTWGCRVCVRWVRRRVGSEGLLSRAVVERRVHELRVDKREAGKLGLVDVGDDQLVGGGELGLRAREELVEVLCCFATLQEDKQTRRRGGVQVRG